MENQIEVQQPVELRENIYQLPSERPGSHVYLIRGRDKNVLIDTGAGSGAEKLLGQLGLLGLAATDIDFVLLTHEHFDHIGATPVFESAIVAAHTLAANKIEMQDEFVTLYAERNAIKTQFYTHLWLDDGITIDIGNYKLMVIHTPGHTSGCMCLYEPTCKLLFSGDTVFAGGTLSGVSGSGAISDYVNSLHKLANLRIDALYPGHGKLNSDPQSDIQHAIEYARGVMNESKMLFEALAGSDANKMIRKRMYGAPISGMSRPPKKD
ncbi:MAG: MBL fold metallo-hydrolase [Chloroflexi bacterium]|nr:MBL fold metallo-hydrolase [Chloroflexota bacterium]MBT7080135.1 MBL fold metallo-hydrolase [Chloroflexota bacterium]MBT7290757.1 MBL fold metallo-hydrolase [Chloroflexota bacterium]